MLDLQRPQYMSIRVNRIGCREGQSCGAGQVEFYQQESTRINPGVPIPPAATAVHGITQAMVKGCPSFEDLSGQLHAFMAGCDIAGYNVRRFVVPMLTAEFQRCDVQFPAPGTRVVDLMRIFHKQEPRDLAGAVQFFLNRPHKEDHGALEDAVAAVEVLAEMVVRYDLPREVAALEAYACGDDATLDGKLQWSKSEDGRDVILVDFGKYKGKTLKSVAGDDPGYINWMLQRFPPDTCAVLEKAAAGRLHEVRRPRLRKQQASRKATTHSTTRLLAVANTLAGRAGKQLEQLLQQQQRSSQAAGLPAELLEQVSQLTQLANKLQLAVGGSNSATQQCNAGCSSSQTLLAFPATPQQVAPEAAGTSQQQLSGAESQELPGSSLQTGSKKGRQLSAQAIEVVKQYFSFRSTINVPGQAAQTDCHTAVFKFGTHKGQRLMDVALLEPSYLDWMLERAGFPGAVVQLVSDAQAAALAPSSLSQLRPPNAHILKDALDILD